MKKYFWIILCVGFFSSVFGQGISISWTGVETQINSWETKKIITQDLGSDNIYDLQKTQARFCNDHKATKDLNLFARPWQRKEICVVFINQSSTPKNIIFWFSEGVKISDWAPSCQADSTYKNIFSKYIKNSTITWVIIPASGTSVQKFTYVVPKNATGNMFGCFGYQMNQKETIKEGNMFLIVPRKVGYISIVVTWSVYQFWRRDDTKEIYTTNKTGILKTLVVIISLTLIRTLFGGKKKTKIHKKK